MNTKELNYVEISFNCDAATFKKVEEVVTEQRLQRKNFFDLCLNYSEEDQAGIVSAQGSDVGPDWEIQLEDLDKLLQEYNTQLEGYFIEDIYSDIIRWDIRHSYDTSEFFTKGQGLMWLADYDVGQIEAIQRYAKAAFPKVDTSRSDSYED